MKTFSVPSVAGTVNSLERAFAPSSLPTIMQQRGQVTAGAEYELAREWKEEGANIGLVVGATAIGVGYVIVKLLRSK